MSLNAAALKMLVDKGFTGDDLVALALCLEKAFPLDAAADKRRAYDRERKRDERAASTGHSTGNPPDNDVSVSLDKKAPQTPEKIKPIPCVRDTRARGWHRLPESWQPRGLPPPVQAKVDLWPPGASDDELAAFRRWAANAEDKNGRGRKLDWDQAWRNWIGRRHDERHRPANSNGIGKSAAAFAALNPGDEPF